MSSMTLERPLMFPPEGATVTWSHLKDGTAVPMSAVVIESRESGEMRVYQLRRPDGSRLAAVMDADPDSGAIKMTFEHKDGDACLVTLQSVHD